MRNCAFGIADDFLKTVRAIDSAAGLHALMRDISDDMGFRHFALISHADLRVSREGQVDLRDYPEGASMRIIDEGSVVDGRFEIDQFDTAQAIYIIAIDETGAHGASMRMLPSRLPHIRRADLVFTDPPYNVAITR